MRELLLTALTLRGPAPALVTARALVGVAAQCWCHELTACPQDFIGTKTIRKNPALLSLTPSNLERWPSRVTQGFSKRIQSPLQVVCPAHSCSP